MSEKMKPVQKTGLGLCINDGLLNACAMDQLEFGARVLDLSEQHGAKTVRAAVERVASDMASAEEEESDEREVPDVDVESSKAFRLVGELMAPFSGVELRAFEAVLSQLLGRVRKHLDAAKALTGDETNGQ